MWCRCQATLLAVLALFLHQVTGGGKSFMGRQYLKCHQCSSMSDPKCGNPIDSSVSLTECTPYLMKVASKLLKSAPDGISSVLGSFGIDTENIVVPDANAVFACVTAVTLDGDTMTVIRSCSVPGNNKFDMCAELWAKSGAVVSCVTCGFDGCNGEGATIRDEIGASGASPNSLMALLVLAVPALLML